MNATVQESPAPVEKTLRTIGTSAPGITITSKDKEHLVYTVEGFGTSTLVFPFQSKRPAHGEASDGLTDDVLIAILEDRLRGYDNSLAKNHQNTEALLHVQLARGLLRLRGNKGPAPQ